MQCHIATKTEIESYGTLNHEKTQKIGIILHWKYSHLLMTQLEETGFKKIDQFQHWLFCLYFYEPNATKDRGFHEYNPNWYYH